MMTNLVTNLVAALVSVVVTNDVPQWQYKTIQFYATYPAQVEETWSDSPNGSPGFFEQNNKRIHPDKRVSEVRRLSFLEFVFDGGTRRVQVSDELLGRMEWRRVVKTDEQWERVVAAPPAANGGGK